MIYLDCLQMVGCLRGEHGQIEHIDVDVNTKNSHKTGNGGVGEAVKMGLNNKHYHQLTFSKIYSCCGAVTIQFEYSKFFVL